ncbi:hypothetical protein GOP47_0030181 [Adiantum capillus-veneris]|nr:hypothetical protein GOP47_0030181 [Adiantum capillus-veneris]
MCLSLCQAPSVTGCLRMQGRFREASYIVAREVINQEGARVAKGGELVKVREEKGGSPCGEQVQEGAAARKGRHQRDREEVNACRVEVDDYGYGSTLELLHGMKQLGSSSVKEVLCHWLDMAQKICEAACLRMQGKFREALYIVAREKIKQTSRARRKGAPSVGSVTARGGLVWARKEGRMGQLHARRATGQRHILVGGKHGGMSFMVGRRAVAGRSKGRHRWRAG